MAKRVFLIHGWGGSPEHGWQPWLKQELEKKGFLTFVPAMPNTKNPKMDSWLKHLQKIVGTPDKECYFIRHSLGCITILRYIESLDKNQKVGGTVLVAGFTDNLGYKTLNTFFKKPIKWDKIKKQCSKIITIFSDNDKYVQLKHADIFREKLNPEIIVQHNMNHFSGDEGVNVLPIALESVLKISK